MKRTLYALALSALTAFFFVLTPAKKATAEIDVGYYTVWQPLGGNPTLVAELVVVPAGQGKIEHWFLYRDKAAYAWPSANNPDVSTQYRYVGAHSTPQDVRAKLDQQRVTYDYYVGTVVRQN
jgi:hypothetical protein